MAKWLQPVVKSMVLCEDVVPGPAGTGNVHLMDVFSGIRARKDPPFPLRVPQICVFLQLTDAEGEGTGSVNIRHAESGVVVANTKNHRIEFQDRLQVKWALFRLKNCTFSEAGVYWVEFYFDGRWVVDLTLPVRE